MFDSDSSDQKSWNRNSMCFDKVDYHLIFCATIRVLKTIVVHQMERKPKSQFDQLVSTKVHIHSKVGVLVIKSWSHKVYNPSIATA